MNRSLFVAFAAAFWLAHASLPAHAALLISAIQDQSGVTFEISGSLDLDTSQGEFIPGGGFLPRVLPIAGEISSGEGINSTATLPPLRAYEITGPSGFGLTPGNFIFTETSGDPFIMSVLNGIFSSGAPEVALPDDYSSGFFFSSGFVEGVTLADMSLITGPLRWDFVDSAGPNNFIAYETSIVPLPATAPMLIAAIAGLTAVRRRRRSA